MIKNIITNGCSFTADSCQAWPLSLEGDYSIGYFCKDQSTYKNFDFTHWFFVNEQKDCLGEFAIDQLDSTGHPTTFAHKCFAQQIVEPEINKITL